MTREEKHIQRRIKRWLESQGCVVLKHNTARAGGVVGYPDLNVWPDRMPSILAGNGEGGQPFFVEVKALGEQPSPIQEERINELRSKGYDVLVAHDLETVQRFYKARA